VREKGFELLISIIEGSFFYFFAPFLQTNHRYCWLKTCVRRARAKPKPSINRRVLNYAECTVVLCAKARMHQPGLICPAFSRSLNNGWREPIL
jgi:hypothetical protein